MEEDPKLVRRGTDTALESLVIGGFIALTFFLGIHEIPDKNAQLFGQALGALTVIATLVGKSLWERRGQTAVVTESAMNHLANSAPAGTGTGSGTAGAVEEGAERGARRGVADGIAGAAGQE